MLDKTIPANVIPFIYPNTCQIVMVHRHTELDHACKVALATIHYTYKDTHDNHFVSEDEIIKVLASAIKMKSTCKFTV